MVRFCVQLSSVQLSRLEQIAQRTGVNRSEVLRRALDQGLTEQSLNNAHPHVSGQFNIHHGKGAADDQLGNQGR